MAATGGSRHKEIWSPVIENEESDEKNETIDLSTTTSKSLMNTIQHHPISFPSFPLPPVFPFGHFGLTRMPFIMPPLNQAFFAMYTKSFQQLPKPHQSETKNVSKKLACSPSKEDNANAIAAAAASAEKATQNPIVNEILKDSLSEQHPINHNVCAVCGEGFRLTGDLVHHMRREKCHWTPKSSNSAAPYQIPKHSGNK